ncbi:MAG: patatin family protein [Coriobacteriales bacterium]|jgi:predicted patatin/cPLA2 family phospholipase|nr:patatin family protein [Coriobacteriales bacterium]
MLQASRKEPFAVPGLYRAPSDVAYRPAWRGASVIDANLVLEGGAMRGQFTAGVLDYLMDVGMLPKTVIGVSAGALNGFHYVAGARGRSCYLNTKYCGDWRYFSLRSFATSGNAFNVQFVFDRIPRTLEPFDFDAYRDSPLELVAVCSNLELGEADYTTVTDPEAQLDYVRASAAMPLVSRIVRIDDKKLLDGGTCDSVPVIHSQLSGAQKHIVVLTQDESYLKTPEKLMPLMRLRYLAHPEFVRRLKKRHEDYNRVYRIVARLAESGEVFLLRPAEPVTVKNMETDPDKLYALYQHGYDQARKGFPDLVRYLEL